MELIPGKDVRVPDRGASSWSNAASGTGSVGEQADLCNGQWGRYPNVVLIDYFGNGNALDAQNRINGV